MVRFADFLVFDDAAAAIYDDPKSQHRCRECLRRLAETARRHPGRFMAEASKKDVRRGVAFKSKSLDDSEHAVFAQRLADRLWRKPDGPQTGKKAKPQSQSTSTPPYGDFLRQGIQRQGDVLGDMNWEQWEVCKAAMELGGVNPAVLGDPNKTPADRLALVNRIDWKNISLPALKARLGASFTVPADWQRQFGVERLKKIKSAVEQGQPIADAQEQKLLRIWRTLEVQLGGDGQPNQILPAGPTTDVGMTPLPMSLADRKRFYRTLTGQKNETADVLQAPLQLSPQSAYDLLTSKYGVQVVSDDEAKDIYLNRILDNLRNKVAFIPVVERGSEADRKKWRDAAGRSWGGFIAAEKGYDPSNAPGFSQWATGMTTRGSMKRTNPSGRQVAYAYPEPEEFQRRGDVPGIRHSIDVPSQQIPDETINAFYRSRSTEANAAVQKELVKPAKDAVGWLQRQGWLDDSATADDLTQQVVMGMMARTGACKDWRHNTGFRRSTAMMLARRFASQGWPSAAKEKTGHMGAGEEQPGILNMATSSNRQVGEDKFSQMQAGAARARAAIQKAIASVLDIDTTAMGGDDEAKFVDAIEALSQPDQAIRALHVLDRLSAQHSAALPQVRKAVDRIRRYLDPLMSRVG